VLDSNTTGIQNTAIGAAALFSNTTGGFNSASGVQALSRNTTGSNNTASGVQTLFTNTTGSFNTAIGNGADVTAENLINATAIGANALVNASNKVRLGNGAVTVIEGQVAFTASSDKTKKENFQPVDGEEVLGKIRGFELTSWNFIGHDPKEFRHYGPMAQDFFAAFGHDGIGQVGSETTINSGDLAGILMIAVQTLEKRTAELKQKEAQLVVLESKVEDLKAKHAYFETVAARLEALELRNNHSIQITAGKGIGGNLRQK
jgi:trimeric autotransporter adhesin